LNGIEVLIETLSIDGGEVVNISPLGADEKRRVLFDRTTDTSVVLDGVITWLGARERVGRVEWRIIPTDQELAMKFVGPRLGEDFDTAVAQLVVFRRERILIWPPLGPAEGPASACKSVSNSSGSSGKASSSLPEMTMAPALFSGFTSTVGAESDT
jgi:hypothetical protein